MKNFSLLVFIFLTTNLFSQDIITYSEWNKQAKTDHRLLPKYGLYEKTEKQKQADSSFISEILKEEQFSGNKKLASQAMIQAGFNYLQSGDIPTAMYRFNQAYLLDSLNTDIYWGYGAVYMAFADFQKAKEQYQEGLKSNPKNTHLLTDMGTYYMSQYYTFQITDKERASTNLQDAIQYLTQSYKINKKDQNTLFKLSICYWIKGDCDKAWMFYNKCKALGGKPITQRYTIDLESKCKLKK